MHEHDEINEQWFRVKYGVNSPPVDLETRLRTMELSEAGRLVLAVFFDGIDAYLGASVNTVRFREASYYIESGARWAPFSFVFVCDLLGLDYCDFRNRLIAMRAKGRKVKKFRTRKNIRR